MAEAASRAETVNRIDGAERVLQRLIDSLQVLVLVLPTAESGMSDPQNLLLTAAAKQALGDAPNLRRHFREPGRHENPVTPLP